MKGYLKIGSYTEATSETPAVIEREFYQQGMIFKDEAAFLNHYDVPCYIPELSDEVYTKQEIINLCGGREDLAQKCFDALDWQHPETWIEEQFVNGEWDECPACKYFYDRYDKPEPCEKCGGSLEYEVGRVSRDGITKVKPDILRQIIDTRQPLGLFYALESSVYTGVDNRNGKAWTEDFPDLRQCKRWLLNPHICADGEALRALLQAVKSGAICVVDVSEELTYRENSNGLRWNDFLYEYTTEELEQFEEALAAGGDEA